MPCYLNFGAKIIFKNKSIFMLINGLYPFCGILIGIYFMAEKDKIPCKVLFC